MVGNYAVIYNIQDVTNMHELNNLQVVNSFMEADKFVDTGFTLFSSHNEYSDKDGQISRINQQVETNRRNDLFFFWKKIIDVDQSDELSEQVLHKRKSMSGYLC